MKKLIAAGLLLFTAGALAQTPAAPPADAAQRAACEALKLTDFAKVVDAPTRVAESMYVDAAGEIPAYCLARGYVAPQVGFQLKLPAAGWNGKVLEVGSGGFAGSTQAPSEMRWCDEAVRRGYACIHSDHGHTAGVGDKTLASLDAVWAWNNPQAELDYAFRGLHVVSLAQKAIAQKYYGAAVKKSYFMGCSGGGRQALVAAQRFPWDHDGIVAMEPAIDLSGAFMTFLYNWRSVTDADGKPLFTPEQLMFMHQRAVVKCDADDGLADGVIGNPRACGFDPAQLACAAGHTADCLTPAQVQAAKKVYAGPVTSKGQRLYPGGVMPGGETGSFGFAVTRPLATLALNDFFRYLAFMPDAGPDYTLKDFNIEEDYKRLTLMEALYTAANPDLRRFRDAGGKLMLIQGWEDAGTPFPLASIDWYESVMRSMGGQKATQEFARLYMMPGRSHCAGGDGAQTADFFGAIEAWAERGEAPDVLKASRIEGSTDAADYMRGPIDASKVKYTRPVYPYPLMARYKGGDVNDWRSFKPVDMNAPVKGR